MVVIKIVIVITLCMISFTAGAVWLQIKETKFGEKAEYDCKRCQATGCQSKYCKLRREEKDV